MASIPCPKCGKLRKINIIIASDGWHQPQCYNCGDPGYVEPVENTIDVLISHDPIYISTEDRPIHYITRYDNNYPATTLEHIKDYLKEHDPEVLDSLFYTRDDGELIKTPTPREEFEEQFGPITDDQWEWLKQFCLRNPVTGGPRKKEDHPQ